MTQQRQFAPHELPPHFTSSTNQHHNYETEQLPAIANKWQRPIPEEMDWSAKIDYYFWPVTSWLIIGAILAITCIAISGMWNNGYNPLIAWSVTANFVLMFAGIAAINKYLLREAKEDVRRDN